jgi:hypothetical protein
MLPFPLLYNFSTLFGKQKDYDFSFKKSGLSYIVG